MYISDPIEIMESRIERMISEYKEGHCMNCDDDVGEDSLYCMSPMGDGPLVCKVCAGVD